MKKNMMVTVVIFLVAGIVAGLAAGYMAAKKQYKPAEGTIVIDTRNTIYLSPLNSDNAHAMSARFRSAAGLCASGSSGGVFEFSDTTARDLVAAIDTIRREISRTSSPVPQYFRGIFGIDANGKTRLIVTGLNAQNREYALTTKIIDGHLPCPYLCDINMSDVIMGLGTTKDPCR